MQKLSLRSIKHCLNSLNNFLEDIYSLVNKQLYNIIILITGTLLFTLIMSIMKK